MSDPLTIIDTMTNDKIISYLIDDLHVLMIRLKEADLLYSEFLLGAIDRSQAVLRLMGVEESLIPTDERFL